MGGQLATAISNAGAIFREVLAENLYYRLTNDASHPQVMGKRYVDDKKTRFLIDELSAQGFEFLFTHEDMYGVKCPLVSDDIKTVGGRFSYDFVGTTTEIYQGLLSVVPNIKDAYNWTHGKCARTSSEKCGFVIGKLCQVRQFSNEIGWKKEGVGLMQRIMNDFKKLKYSNSVRKKALKSFADTHNVDVSGIET